MAGRMSLSMVLGMPITTTFSWFSITRLGAGRLVAFPCGLDPIPGNRLGEVGSAPGGVANHQEQMS